MPDRLTGLNCNPGYRILNSGSNDNDRRVRLRSGENTASGVMDFKTTVAVKIGTVRGVHHPRKKQEIKPKNSKYKTKN